MYLLIDEFENAVQCEKWRDDWIDAIDCSLLRIFTFKDNKYYEFVINEDGVLETKEVEKWTEN